MIGSALLSLLVSAAPAKAKVAVTSLASAGDVDAKVAAAMTEAVTAEIDARGYYEAISSGEIATLLGVERQKQLLGCGEDSTSCVTEIASALGAPFVMSGSLTKLEGIFQLNLQLIDSQRSRTVGRSTKIARDFEGLRGLIPYAVAEVCGTPLPPPPSRVLPIALVSVGGAAMIGGGVLGLLALTAEATLKGELGDAASKAKLNPASTYRERFASAALQRTLSLVGLLAGVALVAGGIVLMPGEAPQPGAVSLVPTLNGFALVGVLR